MKKVLLMNVLYKPNVGGVENSLTEVAKNLIELRIGTDILCSDKNNENNDNLATFENENGINIYRYAYSSNILISSIRCRALLKKIYLKNEYSYFVSRSYITTLIGLSIGIKDIKYIPPEVSFYTRSKKMSLNNKKIISDHIKYILQFLALILSKDVFVFSDSMVNQVKKLTCDLAKPRKINPGIDFKRFSLPTQLEKNDLKKRYDIPNDKKILLALGRFSELKQFDLAILAMKYLTDDYFLIIVGSGPEKKLYESIISEQRLNKKVKIFDSTSKPEVFYKLSDIFLMTSRYESFGQTVLEAAASGLKIIAFSKRSNVNTNIETILENCQGVYLVDEQSSEALSRACQSATKNFERCLENNYNRFILNNRYSWKNLLVAIGIDI